MHTFFVCYHEDIVGMKIRKGFVLRDVVGDKVIVGEGLEAIDFGRMICLNETAAWLWEEAIRQQDFSVSSLVEALCEEYSVSLEKAEADVSAMLGTWQEKGLIDQ